MGVDRTVVAAAAAAQPPVCRARADSGPGGADRDPLCTAQRPAVESAAARDGVWLRHRVLAAVCGLAAGRRLATVARGAAHGAAAPRTTRFGAGGRRQRLGPRAARGKKTGPNPTDRRKAGTKHHLLTEAHGIPLVAQLTAANCPDINALLPLVDALPSIGGRPRRRARPPGRIQGDRGYDSNRHRAELERRGIQPLLAR